MTLALFAAVTLSAWALSLSAITDPYWPNVNARIEAQQIQSMIDGTD
jgi:hypothetical protein